MQSRWLSCIVMVVVVSVCTIQPVSKIGVVVRASLLSAITGSVAGVIAYLKTSDTYTQTTYGNTYSYFDQTRKSYAAKKWAVIVGGVTFMLSWLWWSSQTPEACLQRARDALEQCKKRYVVDIVLRYHQDTSTLINELEQEYEGYDKPLEQVVHMLSKEQEMIRSTIQLLRCTKKLCGDDVRIMQPVCELLKQARSMFNIIDEAKNNIQNLKK